MENEFKFGQMITVKKRLIRFTHLGDNGKRSAWMNSEHTRWLPSIGIYLGKRTLANGNYVQGFSAKSMSPENEDYRPRLEVTDRVKAALVCIKGRKPFYALLSDLELPPTNKKLISDLEQLVRLIREM